MIDGERFSHIIDPRTPIGLGLRGSPAASVHAPSAMVADAWASALCVLGPVHGMQLVESKPDLEGRFVNVQDQTLATSSGFAKLH